MALSFVAQSARGPGQPPVPQSEVDKAKSIPERFLIRWRGEADPKHVKAIDAYWISAAEHGMNASTFTARVVASTGRRLRPPRCRRAVGALSGPLHGGAPSRVLQMLDEVERTGDPEGYVKQLLDRGERLMGFGHRVYRAEDPRARVLRRTSREIGSPRFEVAEALEQAALAELQARKPDRVLATNVEFWSAVVLDNAERAARAVHADVHLRARRRLVRPHPRAEARGPADPPDREVRRAAAAPGVGRAAARRRAERLATRAPAYRAARVARPRTTAGTPPARTRRIVARFRQSGSLTASWRLVRDARGINQPYRECESPPASGRSLRMPATLHDGLRRMRAEGVSINHLICASLAAAMRWRARDLDMRALSGSARSEIRDGVGRACAASARGLGAQSPPPPAMRRNVSARRLSRSACCVARAGEVGAGVLRLGEHALGLAQALLLLGAVDLLRLEAVLDQHQRVVVVHLEVALALREVLHLASR